MFDKLTTREAVKLQSIMFWAHRNVSRRYYATQERAALLNDLDDLYNDLWRITRDGYAHIPDNRIYAR